MALPALPYNRPVASRPLRLSAGSCASEASNDPDGKSLFGDDSPPRLPDDLTPFWAVISQLEEYSSLFSSIGQNDVAPLKLAAIAMKAVRGRLRSSASIRSALGHIRGFVEFFNSNELSDTSSICGPSSLMALRDFFEPLHSRGVTVPRTARAALNVFKDSVGFDWPLDRPLISSVITCGDAPAPKHAPAFTLDLVFKFTSMAEDPMV